MQHWDGKKPRACPGEQECGKEHFKWQTCWKGFASAERWRPGQYQDWAPIALEVTESLREVLKGHELRGTVWRLSRRLGRSGKSECWGEQIAEVDPDLVPLPFDIEPAVCKVYKTTRIEWDAEPSIPAKVLLVASRRAGPPATAPGATPGLAAMTEQEQEADRERSRKILEEHKRRRANPPAPIDSIARIT